MKVVSGCVQEGSGEPVVFVHGSYATTSTWKKMMAALAPSQHVIAIQLPGHCGTSDPTDFAQPTIETELALIESVVAQLAPGRPIHLVGHSYGGVVALALALKGSVPIREMSLFEPVATWVLDAVGDAAMQARVDAFLARYRHDAAAGVPDTWAQVLAFWGGADDAAQWPPHVREGMAKLMPNNLRHWDICTRSPHGQADLQALSVPTRIAHGSASNDVARAIAAHLAAQLPHSRLYEVAGASHTLVTSHPHDCLKVLQDPLHDGRLG
jgi:pimeloyl-ACP methyl ester carboxylesterase